MFNVTGIDRIKRVTGKFVSMINELKKGLKEIDNKVSANNVVISGLRADNDNLNHMATEAENLINGLTKLVKGE